MIGTVGVPRLKAVPICRKASKALSFWIGGPTLWLKCRGLRIGLFDQLRIVGVLAIRRGGSVRVAALKGRQRNESERRRPRVSRPVTRSDLELVAILDCCTLKLENRWPDLDGADPSRGAEKLAR